MYAVMNTNKYTGVVREVSRHASLREANDAHDAMEFKRDASIFEITADADGDEDFEPIAWEEVFARLRA